MTDRSEARSRLSSYLKREGGLGDDEAKRRADEMLVLVGGATAFAVRGASALTENWWLLMLKGILAVLFGVFALARPVAALSAFVLVFGVWAFIDGIDSLALAIGGRRSWQFALIGLVGIGIGLLTFFRPGFTALGLYAAVAAWSIARGILEIAAAVELRKEVQGEFWMVMAGIASILFGVLLIWLPMAGVLALAWLIGIYALMFGVMMFALSMRLRGVHKKSERLETHIGAATPQPV